MKYNKDLFSFIKNRYYKNIYKKINLIQSILKTTFLQELKVVFNIDGGIKDIIIIFGDIEGFSHKSYENMICALKLYNSFFHFNNYFLLKGILKKLLYKSNCYGIDQYIGISLLTGIVIEYYGIFGGIKINKDIVNITFKKEYKKILGKEYPIVNYINNPIIGNIYISGLSNSKNMKKEIFFYDISVENFDFQLDNILNKINNDFLIGFLNCYKNINKKYFWRDFVCWTGYNSNNNKIKHSTLEFVLNSKRRKEILKDLDFLNINDFIEPYICQLGNKEVIMWFLVKESYKNRLKKGYYYYY